MAQHLAKPISALLSSLFTMSKSLIAPRPYGDSSEAGANLVTLPLDSLGRSRLALSVHPYSRINILYNRGPALDFRERLTDALHGELDFIRRPDIDEQDMILAILHQLAQPRFELCAPPPREAALEHGKLEPLAIAVHCLEHAPPPLLVGDVVGDDKQALVRHRACSARQIMRIARQLPQEEA